MEDSLMTTERIALSGRETIVYMTMMLVTYWWARYRIEKAIEIITWVVLQILEIWVTEVL